MVPLGPLVQSTGSPPTLVFVVATQGQYLYPNLAHLSSPVLGMYSTSLSSRYHATWQRMMIMGIRLQRFLPIPRTLSCMARCQNNTAISRAQHIFSTLDDFRLRQSHCGHGTLRVPGDQLTRPLLCQQPSEATVQASHVRSGLRPPLLPKHRDMASEAKSSLGCCPTAPHEGYIWTPEVKL